MGRHIVLAIWTTSQCGGLQSEEKTNLVVRVYLGAIIFIVELLVESLHPRLTTVLFLHLLTLRLLFLLYVVFLIQLVLLPLAALARRFGWRLSDFCSAETSLKAQRPSSGKCYFKVVFLHFSPVICTVFFPHCPLRKADASKWFQMNMPAF